MSLKFDYTRVLRAFPSLLAAALVLLLAARPDAARAGTPEPEALSAGQAAPELKNFSLEGELPDLAGKVVLLDFWASWCAPCKASFPLYSALQRELAPRGLVVLGASVDKQAAAYETFLKRHPPGFATVRDRAQTLVARVRPPTMPTCYLIDRKGVVRRVHSGFHGADDVASLRDDILKLLDETP